MKSGAVAGLDAAAARLGGALLGPAELAVALGFDPLSSLTADELEAVRRLPFSPAELERAAAAGEMLVLRVPRSPEGPLTMLALAERLQGGIDPRAHTGSGYQLRPEWTIDGHPFAASETCAAGWRLVRRTPHPDTLNRAYRAQDAVLGNGAGLLRRTAVEIAFDTLLWERVRGERLLATSWDWSRSRTADEGYVALGEFGPEGLRVTAYSRGVRFGTLGVCTQR